MEKLGAGGDAVMQQFTIEVVRGWRIVSTRSGRILGCHKTDAAARAQVAAISRRMNEPKEPRGSRR